MICAAGCGEPEPETTCSCGAPLHFECASEGDPGNQGGLCPKCYAAYALTPAQALELLEAPFVELSAAQAAEAVADSYMTENQEALFAQLEGLPFREKLIARSRFRRTILSNVTGVAGFSGGGSHAPCGCTECNCHLPTKTTVCSLCKDGNHANVPGGRQ